MIVVTGATGTVGRAVVDQLLATGVEVRAVTRRPQGAGLPPEVEVVRADLGEAEGLADAVAGADRLFLLSAGPDLARHDEHAAEAAAHAGVPHIVKLSSGRAGDAAATDPIPTWHRAGERAVRAAGTAWTMIRPLGFMSNALHWAPTIRAHDTVYAPYGQGRIAVVDPHDIAAVATKSLTEPGHEGRTYTLSGPRALSPGEQTEILAGMLGRPLRYAETTPEQARAALVGFGVDAEMADAIMALRATALESFTARVHPAVEEVTGRPPRSFLEWARENRARFE
ncbi:NAD(P)H-binding protein [Nocardia mexicana]|uniref:Uncharacterized protein YbjT (DUF2867 family) n=1 Tax=Nocardia mexicana TaxID=279262 RepID=A0A370H089_9NOCA|nr:NAD(P)H-binding protein [Nocardia mexicana]RDI49340.1 uncharacterized protein YbjT (DUF2867 family) [Nocardia mexicana]